MKKITIVIFDDFTDIDLFLLWDIFGRNKIDWQIKILGSKDQHRSNNGLMITTHGNISEANSADVVLFCSGKGARPLLNDKEFLQSFSLNPQKQIIGSICSGSLILAKLGYLDNLTATTHPKAKSELQSLGVNVVDEPLVCHGNIATAGGCLAAQYLASWIIEKLFDVEKRKEALKDLLPVGQIELYEDLIATAIRTR